MARIRRDISSAYKGVAVTPSDSTILPDGVRRLWVGGAGAVAVVLAGDTTPVTLAAVPAGTMLEVQVSKVMSTSTTATNIIALY